MANLQKYMSGQTSAATFWSPSVSPGFAQLHLVHISPKDCVYLSEQSCRHQTQVRVPQKRWSLQSQLASSMSTEKELEKNPDQRYCGMKRAGLGQWGPSDNAWKTWGQKYAPLPSPSVTVSNGFYPSSFSSLFFSIEVLATIKTVLFPSACVSFQILIHTQSCRC